jgi:hypothetical protein
MMHNAVHAVMGDERLHDTYGAAHDARRSTTVDAL